MRAKQVFFILIASAWIGFTFWSPQVYAPIGKMLSYSTGILSLKNDDAATGTKAISYPGVSCDILIDSVGVPHIFGKNMNDVSFGLGYMHAKDRYFQMEMMTRVVQGKLSEVIGDKTLGMDSFWRPFRFDEMCKRTLEKMKETDKESYEHIQFYAKGVNHYLQNQESGDRFFENVLLGFKPRKWEEHYTLLLSYYMSNILTYNDWDLAWQSHLNKTPGYLLENLYNYNRDSYPYIYKDSFYVQLDSNDLIIDGGEAIVADQAFDYERDVQQKQGIGSNNWSISGNLSKTGNAILCNDPHLDMNLPGPWYQAHLVTDEINVHGFSIPCSPYIISGHNEDIAWGITNAQWDMVDCYRIKLNEERNRYQFNGAWLDLTFQYDTLGVKVLGDSVLETITCPLGRIIYINDSTNIAVIERWYSAVPDKSATTFAKLAGASNWDEFTSALSTYRSPAQNFVYADKDGNSGLYTAGKLPYRPATFNGEIVSLEEAFQDQEVPFELNPHKDADSTGFSCSANQIQAKTNYYLHHTWVEEYRGKRIQQYLGSDTAFSVDDMKKLQADLIDLSFFDIKPLLDSHAMQYEALMFKNWDGEMSPTSVEAKHFYFLKKALHEEFKGLLGEAYDIKWVPEFSNIVAYLNSKDTLLIGDSTLTTEQIVNRTFVRAKRLEEKWNTSQKTNVSYGEINPFYLDHLTIPGIGYLFNTKGGNANTLNVNSGGNHGSSMRTVIEMGEKVNVWTVQGGGQSGKINSPYYDNQVNKWLNVEYYKVDFSKKKADIKSVKNIRIGEEN